MTAPRRTGAASRQPGDAPTATLTADQVSQGQIQAESPQKRASSQESPLERHLAWSIRTLGLPEPEREYRFDPVRRWRLDFCWPAQRLAVEIEGGVYRGGGHTSVTGIKRDMEKSNALTMAGWRLLRFHGDQVKSGEAVALIRQALGV